MGNKANCPHTIYYSLLRAAVTKNTTFSLQFSEIPWQSRIFVNNKALIIYMAFNPFFIPLCFHVFLPLFGIFLVLRYEFLGGKLPYDLFCSDLSRSLCQSVSHSRIRSLSHSLNSVVSQVVRFFFFAIQPNILALRSKFDHQNIFFVFWISYREAAFFCGFPYLCCLYLIALNV